jgi:hypothetical protein
MTYVYELALVSRLCPAEISLTRLSISPQRGASVTRDSSAEYSTRLLGDQEFESLRARHT